MTFQPPTSRVRLFFRLQWFDLFVAAVCPPLSLILRDPAIFFFDGWLGLVLYCLIGFASAVIIFQLFGVGRGLERFRSMEDAVDVWKAAVGAVALSSAIFFTLTRLDDVPRSVPLIQLILMGTMLSLGRAAAFLRGEAPSPAVSSANGGSGCLVYGANRLAWFYIRMLDSLRGGDARVVAILDDERKHHGRDFCGRAIVGSIADLRAIVEEYRTHGVTIDQDRKSTRLNSSH